MAKTKNGSIIKLRFGSDEMRKEGEPRLLSSLWVLLNPSQNLPQLIMPPSSYDTRLSGSILLLSSFFHFVRASLLYLNCSLYSHLSLTVSLLLFWAYVRQ
ncbi:hypothetical protein Scep_025626 [Stephania cephalantha]|uniref:Uncharacterized protein n=1 Tax=Stephania cephalantha TaxID=152367 RepID=A0AAP0ENU2_9MAGN